MKDPFKIFNVNEFKKWMEDSPEESSEKNIIGLSVSSKVPFKKLKFVCESFKSKKALEYFYKEGGIVKEEEDNILTIETDRGEIQINKLYVVIS